MCQKLTITLCSREYSLVGVILSTLYKRREEKGLEKKWVKSSETVCILVCVYHVSL